MGTARQNREFSLSIARLVLNFTLPRSSMQVEDHTVVLRRLLDKVNSYGIMQKGCNVGMFRIAVWDYPPSIERGSITSMNWGAGVRPPPPPPNPHLPPLIEMIRGGYLNRKVYGEMKTKSTWELSIFDASPPVQELGSLTVGDLDGDGHVEVVVGGDGGLLWYRPSTFEKGVIAEGHFAVGLVLEDLDGDGVMEVVTTWRDPETSIWTILWFKPGEDLYQPWSRYAIDLSCNGSAHDLMFFDIDGDGVRELLANAAYCEVPGVFIYKPGAELESLWHKYKVSTGIFSEGLGAADLNGDGRFEIVHGPDWFAAPPEGPFSGPWKRTVYAPSFREMCRTALVDITGNGRDDIVIAESEYIDGHLSWFENRFGESPDSPWVEHGMDRVLNFAHSLSARRDAGSGEVRVFLAEMAAGGWEQPYNWDARLIEYTTADEGETWQREVISQGTGTHQAVVYDVDQDGAWEVVGK